MAEEKPQKTSFIHTSTFIFLICFLIGFGAWCLIKFSKDYIVPLDYRVVYTELPSKRSSAGSDSVITLTFKTRGFNYLNPKFNEKNRVLYLSVNSLLKNKSKQRAVYYFTRKEVNDYIKNNHILEVEFLEVNSPDTLTLYLNKL